MPILSQYKRHYSYRRLKSVLQQLLESPSYITIVIFSLQKDYNVTFVGIYTHSQHI